MRNPFVLLLTVSLTFTAQLISAQPSIVDSLEQQLQQVIPDSDRVNLLSDLSYQLRRKNVDKGLGYAEEALELATEIGYQRGLRNALNSKASVLFYAGEYLESVDLFNQTLVISRELKDTSQISRSLNSLGVLFRNMGNYPESLRYALESLKLREAMQDSLAIASTQKNIGLIYINLEKYDEALDFFDKALKTQILIGDKFGIAGTELSIGNAYFLQSDYDKALVHYESAKKLAVEIGELRTVSLCLNNIAGIYASKEDYPKALESYTSSLELDEQIGNVGGQVQSLTWIGGIHFVNGDLNKAEEVLNTGFTIASKLKDPELLGHIHEVWTSVDSAKGDYKSALNHFRLSVSYRDSLINQSNNEKVIQQRMQYDFDKAKAVEAKEQEKKDAVAAQELKRQKLIRNGFVGGFAIVLLFAGVFFRQRNRIGKEKERSEELLLNILPEETAQELKDKGHSDAQLIDQVTVLFTDFKGFTALSEQVTPKELVADLHECFSAFDKICEKYGIEKIKTIGDAYMAAGGLPSPNSTHAQDVAMAALEMAQVVEKGKAEKTEKGLPYFEIRIGVHTGPVVAGIVGVKKFQYDIWGDTVNTASRMESSGEVGKVNISQSTYELLKEDTSTSLSTGAQFSFESRGKIEAKGKGEVEMYFVSQKAS